MLKSLDFEPGFYAKMESFGVFLSWWDEDTYVGIYGRSTGP